MVLRLFAANVASPGRNRVPLNKKNQSQARLLISSCSDYEVIRVCFDLSRGTSRLHARVAQVCVILLETSSI